MATKGWTQDDIDRFNAAKAKLKKGNPLSPRNKPWKGAPCTMHTADEKPKRKAKVGKGAQQPNKTEQEYADRFLQGTEHRFQALTFHMRNGCDYTADWITFNEMGNPILAIECKGSHRFHSHGRARLAFRQCQLEYPGIKFSWATKTKEGWMHE